MRIRWHLNKTESYYEREGLDEEEKITGTGW
jgi:hypothetical protein